MNHTPNGHPRERLSEYLDDALEIEARQSVDRHLADCADCRAELAALRRLANAIAEEDVPPVPDALAARVGRSVDEASLARPRFRRFVVPVSIAATIGAVGLLVALQWRQGRLGVPPPPEESQTSRQLRVRDDGRAANAPATTNAIEDKAAAPVEPTGEKEAAPVDHLGKDVKRSEETELDERPRAKKAEAAPESVVVGGTVGGVARGDASSLAGEAEANGAGAPFGGRTNEAEGASRQRSADNDLRRDTGASKAQEQLAGTAPKPSGSFAQAPPPPVAKQKTDGDTSCAERWSDSGVRGSWGVPDIRAAERQLGRIAHAVGGIGLWRGVADGRPYVVVVPRAHFEEVFYALRARGVAGLQDAPPLPEGTDCTGIFVALTLDPTAPATPDR